MIWLTWRQFRVQVLTITALVLALAGTAALTGAQVNELAQRAGCRVTDCDARAGDALNAALSATVPGILYWVAFVAMLALPVLVGIFWGAPLVARELETGTYRMIFSQSVSRRRWLLVKLAVGGLAVALCEGLASLVLTPWAEVIDLAGGTRLSPLIFAGRGIVPIGYGALAFVIGVLAGQLLRRTVTAMAVTLLAVTVIQVIAPFLMLTYLARPVESTRPLTVTPEQPLVVHPETNEAHLVPVGTVQGAWVIDRVVVTPAGTEFRGPVDPTKCTQDTVNPLSGACMAWLTEQNLSRKITIVPGSQFWALQWREFGVLLAVTLGLSALSVRRIRHRPY